MLDHRLEAILATAELGSFTKAAERLHLTPTALVKQVNGYEAEHGLELFVRTPRGTQLTDAGTAFVEDARTITRFAQESIRRARERSRTGNNTVRLGVSALRPADPVLRIWQNAAAELADIQLELVPMSDVFSEYHEVVQDLGTKIDIVAGTLASDLWDGSCQALVMGSTPLMISVPIGDPLAHKDALDLDDLAGRRVHILRRGDERIDRAHDLLAARSNIEIVETGHYDYTTFNECAMEGDLMQTTSIWANVHPALKAIPMHWDLSVPFGILYPLEPSPAVERFITAAADVIEQDGIGMP